MQMSAFEPLRTFQSALGCNGISQAGRSDLARRKAGAQRCAAGFLPPARHQLASIKAGPI